MTKVQLKKKLDSLDGKIGQQMGRLETDRAAYETLVSDVFEVIDIYLEEESK